MHSVNRRTFLKGLLLAALIPKFLIPKEDAFTPQIDKFEPLDKYYKLGYKGRTAYDSGYVYCPYIPMTLVKIQ